MTEDRTTQLSLLAIRVGVMIVFMAWTFDKIVNAAHFNATLEMYYHTTLPSAVLLVVGVIELLLLLVFFFSNRYKTITYGFVLAAHTLTTLVSSWRLFPPFEPHMLLHYATLPTLAGCLLLFWLREKDTLLKIESPPALSDVISEEKRTRVALLLIRVSVAAVFLAWTSNKIFFAERSVRMMSNYYFLPFTPNILLVMGILEIGLVLVFLSGKFRNWTYAAILLGHTASTVVSSPRFFPPYEFHALLYLGAFPMLGACIALYLLRHKDTLFTLK